MSEPTAGTVRVQLQFDQLGEHAQRVAAWLHQQYAHVNATVSAQPGLTISLSVPTHRDETYDTWQGRLIAALFPLDVASEVICECFDKLTLPPAELVSVHLTGRSNAAESSAQQSDDGDNEPADRSARENR